MLLLLLLLLRLRTADDDDDDDDDDEASKLTRSYSLMFISLIKTFQLFILSVWLQIYKRKQLHIVAKEAIWRPFCLCKLDGQDLRISLGKGVYRIQHTQIRLKSLVSRFYPKMPLDSYRAPFFRNPPRLPPG